MPVKDDSGNVIGFVQRDYALDVLDDVVMEQSDDDTIVFIADRDGLLVANSSNAVDDEEDRWDVSESVFFADASENENGFSIMDYDGAKQYGS